MSFSGMKVSSAELRYSGKLCPWEKNKRGKNKKRMCPKLLEDLALLRTFPHQPFLPHWICQHPSTQCLSNIFLLFLFTLVTSAYCTFKLEVGVRKSVIASLEVRPPYISESMIILNKSDKRKKFSQEAQQILLRRVVFNGRRKILMIVPNQDKIELYGSFDGTVPKKQ